MNWRIGALPGSCGMVQCTVAAPRLRVASTDGDNTNLVIAQIAQRRFEVPKVVVRVLDPARARWYRDQGLTTVCPTQIAIEMLEAAVREAVA